MRRRTLVLARDSMRRWAAAVEPAHPISTVERLSGFLGDFRAYRARAEPGTVRLVDTFPCVRDSLPTTPFDPHYFYQAVWATNGIRASHAEEHVDVGSEVVFVALLASALPVRFVDIRPLEATVPGLSSIRGSMLELPFADESVPSLSSLHVVEHVGLGRYGDPIDPHGTQRACSELQRVLAPGGKLWLSLPVGRPRIVFNAHRIHDPRMVATLLPGLELVEFAWADDAGRFHPDGDPADAAEASYACGMFVFRRACG